MENHLRVLNSYCLTDVIANVAGGRHALIYDDDNSVYTHQLRTDLEAGGLIIQ